MIRRLKKDVLHELPEKRRQKIQIAVDDKIGNEVKRVLRQMFDDVGISKKEQGNEGVYQSLLTDYGETFQSYLSNQQPEKESNFMMAYKLTGESKVAGITDFMENLIENNCKFIVFAHHQSVMDSLEHYVKTKKVGYIRICGKVGVDQRHDRVTAFQNDDEIRIAILSITACS